MALPNFSVVIPTSRRNDLLARCLQSLRPGAQLVDPLFYEVLVTDDARGDTAKEMMEAQFPWARWVQGPSRGPAANRNSGACHARGEWICFIDDDCIASEKWIAAFREASAEDSVDLLEGQTTIPDATDDPFEYGVFNHAGGAYWSCNLAVRRERFLALKGFDEEFLEAASEDMEFAHRFHAHHFCSKFYPEALVYHPVRHMDWRGVWKRLCLIRWNVMYSYKVDKGLHLSDSSVKNVLRVLIGAIPDQVRLTWHDIRTWSRKYWRSRLFWISLRLVTFPILLPYHIYWTYRYHQQLHPFNKSNPEAQLGAERQ